MITTRDKRIVIVATLDTKSAEVSFIKDRIESLGEKTLVVNSGVYPSEDIQSEIDLFDIGREINLKPDDFPKLGKVGAMQKIAEGLKVITRKLFEEGEISAIVCLGGGVGMWIGSEMMQQLPVGVPKMIISPIPFRDIKPLLGTKDIILVHSVVDIAGLNPVLRDVLNNSAVSVVAMVRKSYNEGSAKKVVGLSVKGITQKAGNNFRLLLEKNGFEVMAFHASGMGGKAMEEFVRQGTIPGVIELTTQEITGEILGGTTQIEYQRFYTAGEMAIPQLICPGAIETISLGPLSTLSDEQLSRPFYSHSPSFTHVRITNDEMKKVIKVLAERLNLSKGPVTIMIPNKGFSIENIEGGKIFDRKENQSFIDEIKKRCRPEIKIKEVDAHIDDLVFAEKSIEAFLNMIRNYKGSKKEEKKLQEPIVSQGNTPDIIKNVVEKQILNGELKPGSNINQFALTREFNVSMSTVREGLLSLASDGLVHSIPRRGIFVNDIDEEDIKAIFTLRRKLEELVASLVIENITKADINIFEQLLQKMEDLKETEESKKYWEVDIKFHDNIYHIASNKYLTQVISSLEKKIHFIRMKVLQIPERMTSSCRYHRSLVTAFKEKDYKKAKVLVDNNLQRVEKLFLKKGELSA